MGPRRDRVHLGVGRGSETRNMVTFQVEIISKARFLDVGVPSEAGFWSVICYLVYFVHEPMFTIFE